MTTSRSNNNVDACPVSGSPRALLLTGHAVSSTSRPAPNQPRKSKSASEILGNLLSRPPELLGGLANRLSGSNDSTLEPRHLQPSTQEYGNSATASLPGSPCCTESDPRLLVTNAPTRSPQSHSIGDSSTKASITCWPYITCRPNRTCRPYRTCRS